MRILGLAAAIIAVSFSPAVLAQEKSAGELAGAFSARPAVKQISISPSGDAVAYIGPNNDADDVLFLLNLDTGGEPVPLMEVGEEDTELRWCIWPSDERLICQLRIVKDDSAMVLAYTRLVSMKRDGSDGKKLSDTGRGSGQSQFGGSVLAMGYEGDSNSVLMMQGVSGGLGVVRMDVTRPKRSTVVEGGNRSAVSYLADENGRVRIMVTRTGNATGYTTSSYGYFYRTLESDKWLPLSRAMMGMQSASGFRPAAVSSAENIVCGFDKIDGYDALYAMKLDGTGERSLLLSRDDVDVDGLVRIGRNDRVVGVSYATEKRYVEYFDAELDKLAGALAKALPGTPRISWIDTDATENRLIFAASSDTDPGMIYLFDKTTRALSEVLPIRDYLSDIPMGQMQPITYPAADGTEIPGYLTLPPGSDGKNLPFIVMPHGGPGSRDVWGFDWMVQFFVSSGYGVLQPNFRGSAGYGDAWFGRNGFQAWQTAIGDVNDAARWAIAQGHADPSKLAAVGWSYGGYAALQSQVVDPDLFKAIVAIAPVTDLILLMEENRRYSNFTQVKDFIGSGDHVAAGSPARHTERFLAPVLLFHGDLDQNVAVAHSRLMEKRLKAEDKSVKLVEFDDLQHGLDSHSARGRMLAETDMFLREALGL